MTIDALVQYFYIIGFSLMIIGGIILHRSRVKQLLRHYQQSNEDSSDK